MNHEALMDALFETNTAIDKARRYGVDMWIALDTGGVAEKSSVFDLMVALQDATEALEKAIEGELHKPDDEGTVANIERITRNGGRADG